VPDVLALRRQNRDSFAVALVGPIIIFAPRKWLMHFAVAKCTSRFARCARRFGAAAPKSRQLRCRSRRAHFLIVRKYALRFGLLPKIATASLSLSRYFFPPDVSFY